METRRAGRWEIAGAPPMVMFGSMAAVLGKSGLRAVISGSLGCGCHHNFQFSPTPNRITASPAETYKLEVVLPQGMRLAVRLLQALDRDVSVDLSR